MEAAVESRSLLSVAERASPALDIRMLGPLTITVSGRVRPLPPSRKLLALFAYLAGAARGGALACANCVGPAERSAR